MKKIIKKTTLLIIIFFLFSTINTYADTFEIRDYAPSIQLVVLYTILALIPAIVIMMTSFTRIIIVLSFIKNAVGTQHTPPNQVLIGLALFLTLFIMTPIFAEINDEALQPYLSEEIGQDIAIERAMKPLREFMLNQQKDTKDLSLFMEIAHIEITDDMSAEDIPNRVLIPAFIIGELRIAFQMGFLLFIPFLVIDMIVASTLMSMGMMMLPPVMISLPFKILLFILVDGWHFVISSLVKSFKFG